MKKNFLFIKMAVFLAGFWFGGVSMAWEGISTESETSAEFISCTEDCVAQIWGTKYATLAEANAVDWNGEISLIWNVNLNNETLTLTHPIVVNEWEVTISNGTITTTTVENLFKIGWWTVTFGTDLTVNGVNTVINVTSWKAIINWANITAGAIAGCVYKWEANANNHNCYVVFASWESSEIEVIDWNVTWKHNGLWESIRVEWWAKATIEWWTIDNEYTHAISCSWKWSTITIENWTIKNTLQNYAPWFATNEWEIIVNWGNILKTGWRSSLVAINYGTAKWWKITVNWWIIQGAVAAYESSSSLVVVNWWTITPSGASTWGVYVYGWASWEIHWGKIGWYAQAPTAWNWTLTVNGWMFKYALWNTTSTIKDWYIQVDANEEWYSKKVVEAVTVTLVNWEGSSPVQIEKWSEYAVPADPEAVEWKVFMWWYNWDTKYVAAEISEATTLTAKWWYNVTLNLNDWTLPEWITSPVVVEENTAFDSTITPTKDWYLFDWWYTDGELTTAYSNSVINEATSLYAKWSTAYTVTISQANGWTISSDKTTAKEWDTVTLTATPNTNYNFTSWTVKNWDDDVTVTNDTFTMPAGNVTVSATFTAKSSGSSSSWGGGSSRTKTTTTDDTKATTDTAKTDETNADESKSDETKADEAQASEEARAAADAQALKDGYSQEFIDAYNFARKNNITTKDTIREADMDAPLTRIAMAKMLSQYAMNVLGKTPDTSVEVPTFPDVDEKLNKDYNDWVTLAYQLGIMWINVNNYRPFDLVTRAEFGTALSRMLFGLEDGEWNEWYSTHLAKLMEEQIITNNNPNLKELRGYVMIMLMRSAQ